MNKCGDLLFVLQTLWIFSALCISGWQLWSVPSVFQVDGRKSTLSAQSFGAVGDDRVTAPTALDHKRDNSSSLIDMNGDAGSTGISRVVEDPFAETSHVSPATSDSWATFNASPTPPAPPGYPAPKTETSQWADSGWGQQTSNLDSWSSFGTPSPPKVRNSIEVPGLEWALVRWVLLSVPKRLRFRMCLALEILSMLILMVDVYMM